MFIPTNAALILHALEPVVSQKLPPAPGTQWEQDTVLVLMGVDAAEGTENKPKNADTECNSR